MNETDGLIPGHTWYRKDSETGWLEILAIEGNAVRVRGSHDGRFGGLETPANIRAEWEPGPAALAEEAH